MSFHVGCRRRQVADATQGVALPLTLLYPTSAPVSPHRFGPYPLELAMDAPVTGTNLPLVLFSHGNGSTPLTHRGLAKHLARSGFVVALVEHVGNTRGDNRLAGTAANLQNRPRHVSLALDAAFADPDLGAAIAPGRAGLIGESLGGYTVLAAAGGKPWCGPQESPDGKPQPIAVTADPRVHALVLFSPATPWYLPEGSLANVTVPILMRTGDRDDITPAWHGDLVHRDIDRTRIDHRIVANAGHFSFQTPFPDEMVRPDFPPSQDPPGFDRAGYQTVLLADVERFLRKNICCDGDDGSASF
ncbi:alpha/beta hydrolase family protein [Arenimonas oryziterrae]|uniref:Serine aminopeptidase S33 domain-containing protein n=1 Tax=Arenimonas oryziterrae DSM 21050 = YC6267 TaxID=1121015 RepID=A0A091AW49_9GAMM|nr:hypothetical protein [Arenimonas oryziterrae]KFN43681.1 hypothetical protein N789_10415 [Arenimonas oryziterrae DSM 21050 = YC6267]